MKQNSTELNRRNDTVRKLTSHGFRIQFVCDEFVLLCKPRQAQTVHIARVDNGGYINHQTLGDFLKDVFNLPTQELITE